MSAVRHVTRRAIALMTPVVLVAAGLTVLTAPAAFAATGPAPMEQRGPSTVTADPLPTVQIDSGVVWTQVVVGNKVFAGGTFSNARPAGAAPGTSLTPRSNILAYDIRTGQLDTGFAPTINGPVKALAASPDGTKLYVGGTFNTVNGQTRWNFAAFDIATGALSNTVKPAIGGSYVNAIAATDDKVYVGGLIGAAGGQARKNLAAFNASTGAILDWQPVTDLQVDAMTLTPSKDKLIVGGRFSTVNNVSQRGLAAMDLTSGAVLPWIAPTIVQNGFNNGTSQSGKAGIFSLSADSDSVFGTGWVYANVTVGNLEGSFSAEPGSGAIQWLEDCHGDTYGAYSDGTTVYEIGHKHDCVTVGGFPQLNPAPGNLRHAVAYTAEAKGTLSRSPSTGGTYKDWSGQPAPAMVNWFPDWVTGTASGQGQAGWTITGAGDYVVVGGEFPFVNGQRQQGLVRFARPSVAGNPHAQAPRMTNADWVPQAISVVPGAARVTFQTNWDRDDLDLTYKVYRNGGANPVFTTSAQSTFWNRPNLSFTDTGLTPGATVSYRVFAEDGDGNRVGSSEVSVAVTSGTVSPYAQSVLDDNPSLFWRLGEPSGNQAFDWAGPNTGTVIGGVARGATGAIVGDADKASTFSGTNSNRMFVASPNATTGPNTFSIQSWFKASGSSAGGKIVGFGSSATGNSSNYDRHVYLSNGRVRFGVYNGTTSVISSPASYNDDKWHQVVATLGSNGMVLYVDGVQVAVNAGVTGGEGFNGYWRVGGDTLTSWPNRPGSDYFQGSIDDVAIYPQVLTAADVSQSYALGTAGVGSEPTAAFTATPTDLSVAVDGSGSTAAPGQSIASYSWNFGDGTPAATGQTASHEYGAPGSYTITLTVKDGRGVSNSTSKSVTVTAPHQAPVAVIGAEPNGLAVAFNSSGSTTSDGATIVGRSWAFGDGATSTQANPTHTYAAPGTYTVGLTVTDSAGATSVQATQTVTVSAAKPVAAFTETVDGLGVAVNGSASTAASGATITGYSWSWGDGQPDSTGATATHTYAAAGTYPVTLTVTDSRGVTGSITKNVAVQAAAAAIAEDTFTRTSATGWGTADVGGTWSGSAGFSVNGSGGVLTLASKSQTRTTELSAASAANIDATLDVSMDKIADGGGAHFNYLVRRGADGDYRLKLRFTATGTVSASLAKLVGTTETVLSTANLGAYAPNDVLRMRFQLVTGAGDSALKAKVWKAADAEPAAWLLQRTDSQAALQDGGKVAVSGYLTGTATNAPVAFTVDNVKVTAP